MGPTFEAFLKTVGDDAFFTPQLTVFLPLWNGRMWASRPYAAKRKCYETTNQTIFHCPVDFWDDFYRILYPLWLSRRISRLDALGLAFARPSVYWEGSLGAFAKRKI